MARKTQPPAVLSLDEIASLTVNAAADQFAERYTSRTRAFVEMGKLIWHIETRAGLPKGQTIYGLLQKRGVPQSSVNNARLVEKFITTFITAGLVTEARADEIITFRVVNQCHRLLNGKSSIRMEPQQLADLLNNGNKAAIGDELDSLDEHGMTIAGRAEAETARKAEEKRLADLNEQAAAQQAAADAAAAAGTGAATDSGPEPLVVDGTKEEPASAPPAAPVTGAAAPASPGNVVPGPGAATPPGSSHGSRPVSTADVLARIDEIELQSFDLDMEGLAAVRAKLAEWQDLIDNSIDTAKKSEPTAEPAPAAAVA